MREALDKAKARFDELTTRLADPAVAVDPSVRKVSKERTSRRASSPPLAGTTRC
jgi:hypothetical protein